MNVRPWSNAAGCEGKERFASPGLAYEIIQRWQRSTRMCKRRPRVGVAYWCEQCGGWHIGSGAAG